MYIPHTDTERDAMLKRIGTGSLEDLFEDVPVEFRFPDLKLPKPLTEMEILTELQHVSNANETMQELACFLGAGAYNHYVPAVVDSILRRGEFYTAYTPYQPELSQGTLQAIFEYQSLIASLTGMDVCNASHYDGATAMAEAVNMAYAQYRGKRNKVVVSAAINPQYIQTITAYTKDSPLTVFGLGDEFDPMGTPELLLPLIDQQTALVIVQYPDFFGRIFDYTFLADAAHQSGALLAISVNPLALGVLKPPGEFGADIVTGEGQPLGIPLSFGGPYLGLFATRMEYVRKMAGRLVGETLDNRGQRAYVLTLTAREQHIRREKATSNICTNQGLMALASAVYLSLLGKHGLRQVAELCYHKAHYAAQEIRHIPGFSLLLDGSFFNEFVIKCPVAVSEINKILLEYDILGGYEINQAYPDHPEYANLMLLAFTEMNSREEIDILIEALGEVEDD
jgi:glycine dehydrogenase subunit 1